MIFTGDSAEHSTVIVVGGGPAGAACAARLVERDISVRILERERLPRTKLCAGWITPGVMRDLDLDIAEYPHRFNTFDRLVVHIKGLRFRLPGPQHSIRRREFDAFLVARSGAEVIRHQVKSIRREATRYVLDERFSCDYLVGAGGTRCPVYRTFFADANPRARELQAATLEIEFPHRWHDPDCNLWFFDGGLPGYAWYVPKADGYLNCGLGGMSAQLKARGVDLREHWRRFERRLRAHGLLDRFPATARGREVGGYSYFLRGGVETTRVDNAFVCGDAAGLATRDLCEGIGPAIRSGQRAADAIALGVPFELADIDAYSSQYRLAQRALEYCFVTRGVRALSRGARSR